MNLWAFTGNLGRDCEVRYLQNCEAVASFSVGVQSGYGDNAKTSWANCSLFGKRAEGLSQYLKKGQRVAVTGELTLRQYTTKDGAEKSSLDVRVATVDLEGKRESITHEGNPQRAAATTQSKASGFDDFDDDIPF